MSTDETTTIRVPSHIMPFQRERYLELMREKLLDRPTIHAEARARFPFFATPLGGKETPALMRAEVAAVVAGLEATSTKLEAARSLVTHRLVRSYDASYGGGRKPQLLRPAPTEFPTASQAAMHAELLALHPFTTPIAGRAETVAGLLGEIDAAADAVRARVEEARAASEVVLRLERAFTEPRFGGRRAMVVRGAIAKKKK